MDDLPPEADPAVEKEEEEAEEEEEDPLNSNDDVSEEEPESLFDSENWVACQYDKVGDFALHWGRCCEDCIRCSFVVADKPLTEQMAILSEGWDYAHTWSRPSLSKGGGRCRLVARYAAGRVENQPMMNTTPVLPSPFPPF